MNEQTASETLSALCDGEADAATAASLSARWRDDPECRTRWHRYQLIGDVLRSEQLTGRGKDADFLRGLRLRLEKEPVVLAPAPTTSADPPTPARRSARRWAPPAAIAAGFVAAAAVATFMSLNLSPTDSRLAGTTPVPLQVAASATPSVAPPAQTVGVPAPTAVAAVALADGSPERVQPTGKIIRDARLDQYLAAHKQFGGATALGVPSGFLRSATFEGPGASGESR